MREVYSDTEPKLVQALQGKTLVNIMVLEEVVDDITSYSYAQLLLPQHSNKGFIKESIHKAYSDKMLELDLAGLRAARALALGAGTAFDTEVLLELETECQRLRAELANTLALV